MQPAKNKQTEEELITHIKESLMAHEETYVVGAWEKFAEKEVTKKTPVFWLNSLSGIAAILAIGFIWFLLTNKNIGQIKTGQVVKTNHVKPLVAPTKNTADSQFAKPENTLGLTYITKEQVKNNAKQLIAATKINNELRSDTANNLAVNTVVSEINLNNALVSDNEITNQTIVERPENKVVLKVPETKKKADILEFLNKETKKNEAIALITEVAIKENKWNLGLVVAPSFGNSKKLNVGYGLSMNYRLSTKFSLGSGIVYNQMSAKERPDPSEVINSPVRSSIASVGTKSLQSVEQSIAGIDIPLEIRYNINKNIYANVGVSAFAVINQKRSSTYIEEKVVQQSVNVANGAAQFVNVLVLERITETQTPTKVENYSYLGFYNFSFGYKKKIFKNSAFAIEPFIKLPMKEVTQKNLKLIGTGLRLKFDF